MRNIFIIFKLIVITSLTNSKKGDDYLKNKQFILIFVFMITIIFSVLFTSCSNINKKEILRKENNLSEGINNLKEYKDTFVKIKTYFDVSNSKDKDINTQNFILHLKCPNSWDADEGVYSNENGLSMLASGTIKKIDKNVKLDETAYKYTYRNNDSYDFKNTEHIIGINDKKSSYILYKNYDSFTGYVVYKFYDEYVLNLSIIDCPDEETMYNIINSVYLEIPE